MSKRAHPQISQVRRRNPSHLTAAVCIALAAAVVGCGGGNGAASDAAPDGGADTDGGGGADAGSARYLERLESSADFLRLAGEGWGVKYLAPVAGRQAPPLLSGCAASSRTRPCFRSTSPSCAASPSSRARLGQLPRAHHQAGQPRASGPASFSSSPAPSTRARTGEVWWPLFVYSDFSERLRDDQLAEVVGAAGRLRPLRARPAGAGGDRPAPGRQLRRAGAGPARSRASRWATRRPCARGGSGGLQPGRKLRLRPPGAARVAPGGIRPARHPGHRGRGRGAAAWWPGW